MRIEGLVDLFRLFDDNRYHKTTITKSQDGWHRVEMFDSRGRIRFSGSFRFVRNVVEYQVSFSDNPLGHQLGLRKSWMPTQLDERSIDQYWERRKKGSRKQSSKVTLGKLSRMSKEVKATHIKAAKSLLATLSEGG